jgi:predicted permease
VNAVLLRSLPFGDPQRLVYLFTPNPNIPIPREVIAPSYADFYDLKQQNRSFSDMTAFDQKIFRMASQGAAEGPLEKVNAAKVDENFFRTLRSKPEFGRVIDASDNQPGHERVAVIGHALWQSQFGGSLDVLERSLALDGVRYRIVGVMPPDFQFPTSADLPYGNSKVPASQVWVPLALTAQQKAERDPGSNNVIARLGDGVSIGQAQTEMSAMMLRLDTLHSAEMRGWGAYVKSFMDNAVGPVRGLMSTLLGAVALVLLIACGNAANLLLARSAGRARELGVRVALGAGRGRMVRQLMTESLLIGGTAGAFGVALAWLFLRLLPRLDPGNIPRLGEASLDWRVLLFALGVSLLTSLLTGVLPALAVSRMSLTGFLANGGSAGLGGSHTRTQSLLIVAESALVVVLLACAGLLIRSYINVEHVDTGFSQSTVTMKIEMDPRYAQPQAGRDVIFKGLMGRIAALPGVAVAGAVNDLPLSNSESVGFIWVDGYANRKGQMAEGRSVTPGYFEAMRIPLIAGRLLTDADAESKARPAVVNERFAKVYFAGRNPIGGRVSTDDHHATWTTIVGVVADVRHSSLEAEPDPQMYSPNYDFDSASVVVETSLPAAMIAAEMRAALSKADPNLVVSDVHTMGDLVSEASARRRFQTSLLTAFAAIALILALVGLYGLIAYSVGRRTREVGIRMALGAQRGNVVLLVMRNAAWLLTIGLTVGLGCAWLAMRAMRSFLFGVGAHDPATMVSVCALLGICGACAAWIPARRAASIDPMQALRME